MGSCTLRTVISSEVHIAMHTRTKIRRVVINLVVCATLACLTGCYVEDNSNSPPQAKESSPPPSTDDGISGSRQSALGKSLDAAEHTVERADDYNDRLMKEMEED
jgi:hypothetical protein